MKTESEGRFEEFCKRNGLSLVPVHVGAEKTPDYTLTLARDTVVIVEVKEILPTPEEQESERVRRECGVGKVVSITPGERVRKKIADCSPQIKARTRGEHAGLLVLWEQGICGGRHTEPYHVRVAMAGFEQMLFEVPPIASGRPVVAVGLVHGPRRKMTPSANTSISAVAVLCVPGPGRMLLLVYHNRHAAIPIEPDRLRAPEVLQYALKDDSRGTTEWEDL